MAEFHALTPAHLGTSEPCADVIALLRDALAMAERGEITGVVIGVVEANNSTRTSFAHGVADKGMMMLATHSLHTRITRLWYDSDYQYTDVGNGA